MKRFNIKKDLIKRDPDATFDMGKEGYVYLFQIDNTKFFKIGRSKDPERRIKEVQTSSPFKVNIILVLPFFNVVKLERQIQNRFKKRKANSINGNEWFELDPMDYKWILFSFKKYVKLINAPDFSKHDLPTKFSTRLTKGDISFFKDRGRLKRIEKQYKNLKETKVPFGKWEGKTLLYSFKKDRQYFEWLIENYKQKDKYKIFFKEVDSLFV